MFFINKKRKTFKSWSGWTSPPCIDEAPVELASKTCRNPFFSSVKCLLVNNHGAKLVKRIHTSKQDGNFFYLKSAFCYNLSINACKRFRFSCNLLQKWHASNIFGCFFLLQIYILLFIVPNFFPPFFYNLLIYHLRKLPFFFFKVYFLKFT